MTRRKRDPYTGYPYGSGKSVFRYSPKSGKPVFKYKSGAKKKFGSIVKVKGGYSPR